MNINKKYQRVIPRDLFNEAKLLKCIGQLVLMIGDRMTPVQMGVTETGKSFEVGLMDEGCLTIVNLEITIKKRPFLFKTTYNSKANYPLFLEYEYCDYRVFDENGQFDQEFIDFCNTVS